jgi:hypothetical protein
MVLLVSIPCWLTVLVLLEYGGSRAIVPTPSAAQAGGDAEDNDVRTERARVSVVPTLVDGAVRPASLQARFAVISSHLRKLYPRRATHSLSAGQESDPVSFAAVADLCLQVNAGDVTGLLGANGAGKSTAVGMMVGEIAPTSGWSALGRHNVTSGGNRGLTFLGVCPQTNPLFELLTGARRRRPRVRWCADRAAWCADGTVLACVVQARRTSSTTRACAATRRRQCRRSCPSSSSTSFSRCTATSSCATTPAARSASCPSLWRA